MQNLSENSVSKTSKWIRPWNIEKFDELSNRDERFFSIVLKGALGWLTQNIEMYNKPIKHFILSTGSAYMYVESNGYEFSWTTTSGEDQMYMHLPRCTCALGNINITQSDLSQPFSRGIYERKDNDNYRGFNAEIRRMPITISMACHYVLSNMNEALILVQEIIDRLAFQKYFTVSYLGQKIECSIQVPDSLNIEMNKIDFEGNESNVKHIDLDLTIHTNYPSINTRSEIPVEKVIRIFNNTIEPYANGDYEHSTDIHEYTYGDDEK